LAFKFKLAILFLIIPVVCTGLYLYVASAIFKKDKTAYVQANVYLEGVNSAKKFQTSIEYNLNLVKSILESGFVREGHQQEAFFNDLVKKSLDLYQVDLMKFSDEGWKKEL
jgi:hypothetical protein